MFYYARTVEYLARTVSAMTGTTVMTSCYVDLKIASENQLKTKVTNHFWFLLSSFLTISTTRNTKKQIKYKKQILHNNNHGSIQKASTFIGSCRNFLWFSRRNRFSNSNAYLARSWHTDRNAYLARSWHTDRNAYLARS